MTGDEGRVPKVLFIMTRWPFPAGDGRRRLLRSYLRLLQRMDFDVRVVLNGVVEYDHKSVSADLQVVAARDPLYMRPLGMARCLMKGLPLQCAGSYHYAVQHAVNGMVKTWKPDFVVCDMVRTTPYASTRRRKYRTIANLDDMLSRRYSQQAKLSSVGEYWSGRFGWIDRVPLANWLLRFLFLAEGNMLRRYELRIAHTFDVVTLVSPKEANLLATAASTRNVLVWPMDIDAIRRICDSREGSHDSPVTVVFLGRLDVPHNVAAVLFLLREIWPKILAEMPTLQLNVVGEAPVAPVLRAVSATPSAMLLGWVEHLAGVLNSNAICVAPLLFGSGIKTKVLEGMAYGAATVVTSVAAEGLEVTNMENVIIADDAVSFAEAVVRLARDANLRLAISAGGRLFADAMTRRQDPQSQFARAFSTEEL